MRLLDLLRDRLAGRPALPRLAPEHRAILGLLVLALGGQGVRLAWLPPAAPPGAFAVPGTPGGAAADPLAHADSARRRARSLQPGERVDADRASVAELARVPGVGAGLAKRMVEHRMRNGAFGSLEGVDRVPGIGPAKLSRIAPYLAFSGVPAAQPPRGLDGRKSHGPMDFGPAPALPLPLAGAPRAKSGAERVLPSGGGGGTRLDLNRADSVSLVQLPGIGSAKAGTIVRWRAAHGPFRSADDLASVPGIGRRLADRIWAVAAP
jgi:competence protein ComEA